jgi:hypothetical protein
MKETEVWGLQVNGCAKKRGDGAEARTHAVSLDTEGGRMHHDGGFTYGLNVTVVDRSMTRSSCGLWRSADPPKLHPG